jgi:hypothetical protein
LDWEKDRQGSKKSPLIKINFFNVLVSGVKITANQQSYQSLSVYRTSDTPFSRIIIIQPRAGILNPTQDTIFISQQAPSFV